MLNLYSKLKPKLRQISVITCLIFNLEFIWLVVRGILFRAKKHLYLIRLDANYRFDQHAADLFNLGSNPAVFLLSKLIRKMAGEYKSKCKIIMSHLANPPKFKKIIEMSEPKNNYTR